MGWREKYLAWKGAKQWLLVFCILVIFGIWLRAGCELKRNYNTVNSTK